MKTTLMIVCFSLLMSCHRSEKKAAEAIQSIIEEPAMDLSKSISTKKETVATYQDPGGITWTVEWYVSKDNFSPCGWNIIKQITKTYEGKVAQEFNMNRSADEYKEMIHTNPLFLFGEKMNTMVFMWDLRTAEAVVCAAIKTGRNEVTVEDVAAASGRMADRKAGLQLKCK